MTSQYLLSIYTKSNLDIVLVGVEAAAMKTSALLELREFLEEACLGVLRHSGHGVVAARDNDSLAGVDGTGPPTIHILFLIHLAHLILLQRIFKVEALSRGSIIMNPLTGLETVASSQ